MPHRLSIRNGLRRTSSKIKKDEQCIRSRVLQHITESPEPSLAAAGQLASAEHSYSTSPLTTVVGATFVLRSDEYHITHTAGDTAHDVLNML